jgi:hypothetical protein
MELRVGMSALRKEMASIPAGGGGGGYGGGYLLNEVHLSFSLVCFFPFFFDAIAEHLEVSVTSNSESKLQKKQKLSWMKPEYTQNKTAKLQTWNSKR